jgi:hypothetical protein
MKKYPTTLRNLSKFLFVSVTIAFLPSCMSTTQFASRKYTKGHFSDPIAKVNVDLLPSGANTTFEPAKQTKTIIAENSSKSAISVPVTETKISAAPKQHIIFTSKEKSLKVVVSNSPAGINKDNVSLSENSVTSVTEHHGDNDSGGGGGHHFLARALICLLIALLATILAIAVGLGGALGLAVLFYVIAVIAWIAFVVFAVLWLIDILGGM